MPGFSPVPLFGFEVQGALPCSSPGCLAVPGSSGRLSKTQLPNPAPNAQPSSAPKRLRAPRRLLLQRAEAVGGLCLSITNTRSAEAPAPAELPGSHLCQHPSPAFPPVSSQGITLTKEIPRICRLGLILLMCQMEKSGTRSHLPFLVVIGPSQSRNSPPQPTPNRGTNSTQLLQPPVKHLPSSTYSSSPSARADGREGREKDADY